MAKITWPDRTDIKAAIGATYEWAAAIANEVKTSVNDLYDDALSKTTTDPQAVAGDVEFEGIISGDDDKSGSATDLDYIQKGYVDAADNVLDARTTQLEDNQFTSAEAYSTFADEGGGLSFLPTTGTAQVSYKVTNDPDSSKNGYYHWETSAYVKDADLVENTIEEANTSDGVSGRAVFSIQNEIYPYKKNQDPLQSMSLTEMQEFIIDLRLDGTRDESRSYAVNRIKRSSSGKWEVRVSSEEVIEGSVPSVWDIVASFETSTDPESGDSITVHDLSEEDSSGITGQVAVNWSKINTGTSSNLWAGFGYALDDNIFDSLYGNYLNNNNNLLINQLPFEDKIIYDQTMKDVIQSIAIFEYYDTEPLIVEIIVRGPSIWRFRIAKDDGTDVVNWSESNYTEPDLVSGRRIDNIVFTENGVTLDVIVDWEQMSVSSTTPTGTEENALLSDSINYNRYNVPNTNGEASANNEIVESIKNPHNLSISNFQKQIPVTDIQKITGDYNHIFVYGQSLAAGAGQSISTTNIRDSKMIGDEYLIRTASDITNLYDLVANSGQDEENQGIGACNAFKILMDNYLNEVVDRQMVMTAAGQGGTSIEFLSKDSPVEPQNYNWLLTAMNNMKTIADGEGKTVRCPVILFAQGEANMTENANQNWDGTGPATNDKTEYKDYMIQLFADMVTDIKSIYGQDSDPIILCYQTKGGGADGTLPIQMAQLEYCNETYNAFMFTPTYFLLTGSDGTHPTGNGYRWMGEYTAKTLYKALLKQEAHLTLQPRKLKKYSVRNGLDYVDIDYYVPFPPIVKNDETTPLVQASSVDSLGFQIYEDGGTLTIGSVEIYNTWIRIYLTSAYSFGSGNVQVTYGDSDGDGLGNISDSDNFKAFTNFDAGVTADVRTPNYLDGSSISGDKYPLYGFSPAFSYEFGGSDEIEINI